jgi:DNA-binding CsgD family transcriptional regulator
VPSGQASMVGRDEELAELDALLDAVPAPTRAVLIEGDAGVGKSTLWREALRHASDRGYTVMSCRLAEAEAKLSYQALSDMLEPVVGEAIDRLPLAQRRALEVAVLGSDAAGRPVDQRTVYSATLAVLRILAGQAPLVVAIDDLQWLDGPSARALDFALRRLAEAPVAIVATRRTGASASGIVDTLRELPGKRVSVGPLSLDAIQRIVSAHLGVHVERSTLTRIHRASGGNPLFALEMADALAPLDHVPRANEPLPVPKDLKALLLERIRRLPAIARAVLLIVALAAQLTYDLLDQLDDDGSSAAVERARRAGILVEAGADLRFTHPLFASAVESTANPSELRTAHHRLAAVVHNEEARARHLALSTDRPDQVVAASLEAAAASTQARGAPDAAAELVELAQSLTPPDRVDDLRRRGIALAEYSFSAGDTARALALLEDMVASSPPGPERAELLRRLVRVHSHRDSLPAAIRSAEQALAEAGGDPALSLDIERELLFPLNVAGAIHDSRSHATRVIALSEQLGDTVGAAQGLAVTSLSDFMLGRGVDREAIAKVLAADPAIGGPAMLDATGLVSHVLAWTGEVARGRTVFDALRQRLVDEGDEGSLPNILFRAAYIEIPDGDWSLASRRAEEAEDICRRTGQDTFLPGILSVRSVVHAFQGDAVQARACAEHGMSVAAATGAMQGLAYNTAALGFLASSIGEPALTDEHLGPLVDAMRGAGVEEPATMWWLADEIEALVAVGRIERASALTEWLDERSRAIDRSIGLAVAARCRGLRLAVQGDAAAAAAEFEEALSQHERQPSEYELARTLLAKGRVDRRDRKWGSARDCLERARALFEGLGGALWVERAGEELGRIGGRTPSSGDLSETERRVAELVASGMTNRQVADALFMSPRTVQSNLSRVFRKLGVRSRAELAAREAAGGHNPPDLAR